MRKREFTRKQWLAAGSTSVSSSVVPMSIFEQMREKLKDTDFTLSMLIAFALDKELDAAEPFRYVVDVEHPDIPYEPFQFIEQGEKVIAWLRGLPEKGVSLELIVLFRREIGIPEKIIMELTLRELIKQDLLIRMNEKSSRYKLHEDLRKLN